MMAKTDGRYRRAIVNVSLESPTFVVVDPQVGYMFWIYVKSAAKIEVSWMDGSKRRPLITDGVRHPAGLAVDYSMDHSLYWVDTKLNTIESMRHDGSNRKTILRGNRLKHPISLDVFESNLFWVTKDTGKLLRQDKFGQSVPVTIQGDHVNPSSVEVYHNLRYNTSINNPCRNNDCSHLCLLVPGGHRCTCPDTAAPSSHRSKAEITCDAASERPRPATRVCASKNGGLCRESDTTNLVCECPPDFHLQFCDVHVAHRRNPSGSYNVAIVIPIVVILLVLGAAVGVWFFLRKSPCIIRSSHGYAIIAPSSVTNKTSPQVHVRHRELEPASDMGKDTQKLVEEDC